LTAAGWQDNKYSPFFDRLNPKLVSRWDSYWIRPIFFAEAMKRKGI